MQKKSIVKKQLILYTSTITICVFLLGVVLSTVYSKHYLDEKREEMARQGKQIAEEVTRAYRSDDLSNLSYELQILEEYMDAGVLLLNQDGVIIMNSPGLARTLIGQRIVYQDVLDGMESGNIVSLVTKGSGLFETPMLVVGYPLDLGQMLGILICRPMPEIQSSIYDMYRATTVSFFLVFIFGIVISNLTYRRLTRPLMEMNRAARVIANGNFEQRVEITSEDELSELGQSFNHMAESLENHENTRREFIANVSHDLRSPLTSMQGFLTAMLDGTIPKDNQEKYMKIVLEETYRLTRLTEGIVDLSRAENSRILLDETDFDMNAVLRNAITLLEPQLNKKQLAIMVAYAQQETMVHGDQDKISRVVQNLLANAVKFSNMDGIIELETTILDNKKVLVTVTDYGIGISEEDQKYIFDRFYKGDATRNHDKIGSGIGLSIVREFIHAHGETITVKSEEGVGSTFAFSLKIATEE